MNDASDAGSAERASARAYRLIWRWHFYAGLFCVPFVVWLACTGMIYLFRPQVEPWLEQRFAHVTKAPPAPPSKQAAAAVAAVPGGSLFAYELPLDPHDATRILVSHDGELTRVFVDPSNAQVLGAVAENERFMRVVMQLHGELRMGSGGSILVELAASWTILMLLTGLYLWWPRRKGLGGTLYPRLGAGGRIFWRDLHAVTGVWVSLLALFLLVSGLPWAKSWGGMLKALRQSYAVVAVNQDWSTGSASERAAIRAAEPDDSGHHHGAEMASRSVDFSVLDRLVPSVVSEHLAPPVLIAPPSRKSIGWTAHSDAANRPARSDLALDAATGAVLRRTDFAQRPLLDRLIGYGIAIHEGQLFPPLNQALGVFTALGLLLMCASSIVLWRRRRISGTLGAPGIDASTRSPLVFVAAIILIGCALPLLGGSLLLVLIGEYALLRRVPRVAQFLGLRCAFER
jgi:uncharacterized iron-regulated membrane protein